MPSKTVFFTNGLYASRLIRGEQIAERIGALVDKGVPDGCKNIVFVKCFPSDIQSVYRHFQLWVDPVDTDGMFEVLREYPAINVIAISQTAVDYIQARLWNKVVYLPEHHCNFDNLIIPHRPVETVGFIGYKESFDLQFGVVENALKELGLKWSVKLVDEKTTRQDVVDFYQTIDVQLCFRGPRMIPGMPPELKNPLKVVNAASFGIPTVSYPELSYMREFPPLMVGKTMDDITSHIGRIKTMNVDMRHQLVEKARIYHIDNVASMYKEILGE